MKIDKQIEELRLIFRTKKIVDESNAIALTDEEMNGIIDIIQSSKKSGEYYLSDELNLVLSDGYAKIVDCDE